MALPATDLFNAGGNGINLSTYNASWTVARGQFQTSSFSDKVGPVSGQGICLAYWNADSFNENHSSACGLGEDGGGDWTGCAVRVSGSGATAQAYVLRRFSGGTMAVSKITGGTTIVDLGSTFTGPAAGTVVRLEVSTSGSDAELRVYWASTLQQTRTDSSSPLTGGASGIGGAGTVDTAEIYDWVGDNLAPPAVDLAGAAVGSGAAAAALRALGARYARPDSDITVGPWTPSSGGTLAPMLDETTAEDSDYIAAAVAGSGEIRLRGVVDPASSSGHVIRWRSPAGYTPSGGLVVTLLQGATQIAQWTTNPVAAGTTYEHTLSGAEADAITDYDDLRVRLQAIT